MHCMNVLLSCVGRRNYLVRYFKEALNGRGLVLAADSDPTAPGLKEADRGFVVPKVTDSSFCTAMAEICNEHRVNLLVPLNDLELPVLAHNREVFIQVRTLPLVSSPSVIHKCLDKWETVRFLDANRIPAPKTYYSLEDVLESLAFGRVSFPLVVKPRWGTASIGVETVRDHEELHAAYLLVRQRIDRSFLAWASRSDPEHSIIIQEHLQGPEFGLDVINDLQGCYVTTFAKRKISMRAGETDKAVTVDSKALTDLGGRIGRALGHVGILDCDVMEHEGEYKVLELNPRFGGGYPFSHEAGANVPAALLAWAEGREPEPQWLECRPNVTSSKYEALKLVSDGARAS